MRIIVILAVLAAPALGAAQEAEEPEDTRVTVVVVPLSSKPAIPGIEVLTEELRTQVARHGAYRLVTPEEMNAIDGELQRQLAGGCDEASCIAELGGALGARYLITGRIGKLGSTFSLNIKLIDIEKVSAANAASAHGKSVEDFLSRMPAIATQLLGASRPQPSQKKKAAAKKSSTLAERLSKAFGGNNKTPLNKRKNTLLAGIGIPYPGIGIRYQLRPISRLQLELNAGFTLGVGLRAAVLGNLEQGASLHLYAGTGVIIFELDNRLTCAQAGASYKTTLASGVSAALTVSGGYYWVSGEDERQFAPELSIMLGRNF